MVTSEHRTKRAPLLRPVHLTRTPLRNLKVRYLTLPRLHYWFRDCSNPTAAMVALRTYGPSRNALIGYNFKMRIYPTTTSGDHVMSTSAIHRFNPSDRTTFFQGEPSDDHQHQLAPGGAGGPIWYRHCVGNSSLGDASGRVW